MAKAVVFFADGFEEIEAISVVDILRRAEVEVFVVGLKEQKEEVVLGSRNLRIIPDLILSQTKDDFWESIDILILPGGLQGTMCLAENKKVLSLINLFYQKNKLIAAICAAPYVLDCAGLLKGHQYTCYPSIEEKIKAGEYVKEQAVVVSKNIITSRGPGTAITFALFLVKLLAGQSVYENLKTGLLADYVCI